MGNVLRANAKSLAILISRLLVMAGLTLCASCSVSETEPKQSFEQVNNADHGVLDPQQRQFLWDVEHLAFVLEQKVFPVFKKAISEGNVALLWEYLAQDFVGVVPGQDWGDVSEYSVAQVRQLDRSEIDQEVDGNGFLERLTAYRKQFDPEATSCRVGIGLVRLGPVDRTDLSSQWNGRWRVRLKGTSADAPLELTMDLAVELDPLDDDLPDRRHWIRSASVERVKLVSSQHPLMTDATDIWGIDDSEFHDNWRDDAAFKPNTGGVYFCDYNQDGHLDVLLEDVATGIVLYRGQPEGGFVDATEQAGLPRMPAGQLPAWVLSCWADFDGDGDEDLLSQSHLYENLGDGTFRDVTKESNILLTPAAGYAVADYDLDGQVDLYVCHTGAYRVGQRQRAKVSWIDGGLGIDNVLWRNNGNWQFEDVTGATGTGGDGKSSFSAVWFDANNDRRPDLLAINEFGENVLFLNRTEGPFLKVKMDPVFGGFSMGITCGDYDNDGHSDIYIANMYSKAGNRILANVDSARYPKALYEKLVEATKGNKLYRSLGDGNFEVVNGESHVPDIGWAYGANFVDLDGNGFLDLYATAGFKSVQRGKPDG